ncbi:MAG TPA: D-serine ammonia-lyase, partial [Coprothermobacter proteolyticus]|nr:D-serine ammonia-lyase [Coprothermobacter proteolyticus]
MDEALLSKIKAYQPVFWRNFSKQETAKALKHIPLGLMDIEDAEKRLQRFAPAIKELFPETNDGIIESSHTELKHAEELKGITLESFSGPVYAKLDNCLPISGSVKARGGIYEVLWFAEQVALQEGIITLDSDYRALLAPEARNVFSGYSLVVGSTGNLGLSIGIMGRAFGFNVEVHMSKEAAAWKKDKLRSLGARVVEHEGDYSSAVAQA